MPPRAGRPLVSELARSGELVRLQDGTQLEQRAKRDHFDELVRTARKRLDKTSEAPSERLIGTAIGTEGQNTAQFEPKPAISEPTKSTSEQGQKAMARLGIEPRTPRFSVMGRPALTPCAEGSKKPAFAGIL